MQTIYVTNNQRRQPMKISYKELVSKFVHGKVTDKDIIRAVDYNRCLGNIDIAIDCMELARADERQKLKKQVCTCCLERIFKEATNEK